MIASMKSRENPVAAASWVALRRRADISEFDGVAAVAEAEV